MAHELVVCAMQRATCAGIVVAFVVVHRRSSMRFGRSSRAITRLRDFAFDSYQRIEAAHLDARDTPVRIVDIDEAGPRENSVNGRGPAPIGRARWSTGSPRRAPAVIAFDAVFAEPDRSSISRNWFKRLSRPMRDPATCARRMAARVPGQRRGTGRRHGSVEGSSPALPSTSKGAGQTAAHASGAWPSPANSPAVRCSQQSAASGESPSNSSKRRPKGNGSVNTDVDSVDYPPRADAVPVAGARDEASSRHLSDRGGLGWHRRHRPI